MDRLNLDREALDRLDMFVKYVEITLSRLDNVKEQLNSNGLLYKLVEGLTFHEIYVSNLKKFLIGEIDWSPLTYTQCNFGKIYYSIDRSNIENTYGKTAVSIFERIGYIHMSFHETVEECIKSKNNHEFKMLIIELTSKSRLLVDMMLKLLEMIPRY